MPDNEFDPISIFENCGRFFIVADRRLVHCDVTVYHIPTQYLCCCTPAKRELRTNGVHKFRGTSGPTNVPPRQRTLIGHMADAAAAYETNNFRPVSINPLWPTELVREMTE